MPHLPVELTDEIIDVVTECHPESLADCALVSHQWNPRSTHHLYRIFRAPIITTFNALHAFSAIVEKRPSLGTIAISLSITPDPELNSSFGTYIPFHYLSSRILPHVHQLTLGETLRWSDYPLLYLHGTVGFTFHAVTALEISCHFNSVLDLFNLIRSFRNAKKLVVLKPVLDICGDFVVNLSVLCPRISAISMNATEDGQQLVFGRPLTSLLTVKIAVPLENSDTANYPGLQKLHPLLIAPIAKPNVTYSLFLCCPWHPGAVRYHVAVDAKMAQLQQHIRTFVQTEPVMGECSACLRENPHGMARSKEALLVGINYATNRNLVENGFPIRLGAHNDVTNIRRLLINKYGYSYQDITTLVDAEDVPHESKFWPTRKNIISAMEKLISGKQPGDHIVFSFSGHSDQLPAIFDFDEVDGMDEILLAVDVIHKPANQPDVVENFIRDDEIRDILVNQLPEGVRCTMIFDCCHSGTMSDLPNVELWNEPDSKLSTHATRSEPAHRRISRTFTRMETVHDEHADSTPEPHMGPITCSSSLPSLLYLDKEVTSWSACMDDQLAFASKRGGLFTREFTQILASTPHPTHKQLLEELRKRMRDVVEVLNKKLKAQVRESGGLPHESELYRDFVVPVPQLGSLRPDSILLDTFTL